MPSMRGIAWFWKTEHDSCPPRTEPGLAGLRMRSLLPAALWRGVRVLRRLTPWGRAQCSSGEGGLLVDEEPPQSGSERDPPWHRVWLQSFAVVGEWGGVMLPA